MLLQYYTKIQRFKMIYITDRLVFSQCEPFIYL